MIQLNLLPDVKLEYIKAQRQRRLIFTASGLISIISIVLLGSLLAVGGLQKKHLSDLEDNIKTSTSKLKGKPQIGTILTVQNQLNSLTGLHDSKPATSRMFDYINQVTPSQINIGDLKADFLTQTIIISGNTDSLSTVNKYIDTLKLTTYKVNTGNSKQDAETIATKAFSNVVMSTFSIDSETKEGPPAKYSITLNYDPTLFDITQKIIISIPNGVSTRSATNSPTDLFQSVDNPNQGGNN